MILWDWLLRRVVTKVRQGGGLDVGFDTHERTVGLSGSSKPMYWKVRLCFEVGYDLVTMDPTRMNLKGIKGSKGWLETREKM